MGDAFREFQTLDPSEVLQIVADRESVLLPAIREGQDLQEEILERECPECEGHLQPKLPSDPAKIFKGLQVQYQAWCPRCKTFR